MKTGISRRWYLGGGLVLILLTGCLLLATGGFIYLKALVARALLQIAWQKTVCEHKPVKPWPWADTFPVARLSVPVCNVEEIVLAGVQGPVLAFGPGHVIHTGDPCGPGNCVIAGHRDTSFRFLKKLSVGTEIIMENRQGVSYVYTVVKNQIVTINDTWVLTLSKEHFLTLLTCYPFDEMRPGPLRYVVWAEETRRINAAP